MSAMTSGRFAPRVTHCVMKRISSSVTGTVDSRPCTNMPDESPTRIRSTPAASAGRPPGAEGAEVQLDPGRVGEAAARRVVRGNHDDLLAASFLLQQLRQWELAGG